MPSPADRLDFTDWELDLLERSVLTEKRRSNIFWLGQGDLSGILGKISAERGRRKAAGLHFPGILTDEGRRLAAEHAQTTPDGKVTYDPLRNPVA